MVKVKAPPRVFSQRGMWRYSRRRNQNRVEAARKGARTLIGMNNAAGRLFWWFMRLFGVHPWQPPKVSRDNYHVEVGE